MEKIIIHSSDTPDGRWHTAADIHRWHLEKGWDGIGYHHVIRLDGCIEDGRPHYWIGCHAKGYNTGSIGICLIGRNQYTDEQYDSLYKLILELKSIYPNARVIGHYQVDPKKTCPNFDVPQWLKNNQIK